MFIHIRPLVIPNSRNLFLPISMAVNLIPCLTFFCHLMMMPNKGISTDRGAPPVQKTPQGEIVVFVTSLPSFVEITNLLEN